MQSRPSYIPIHVRPFIGSYHFIYNYSRGPLKVPVGQKKMLFQHLKSCFAFVGTFCDLKGSTKNMFEITARYLNPLEIKENPSTNHQFLGSPNSAYGKLVLWGPGGLGL